MVLVSLDLHSAISGAGEGAGATNIDYNNRRHSRQHYIYIYIQFYGFMYNMCDTICVIFSITDIIYPSRLKKKMKFK